MALVGSAMTPPRHGRLLLFPMVSQGVDPAWIREMGLAQIGTGPVAGSLVVEGPGLPLASYFLSKGVLMTAAPAAFCSAADKEPTA